MFITVQEIYLGIFIQRRRTNICGILVNRRSGKTQHKVPNHGANLIKGKLVLGLTI